jgi:hypothetical protein
VPKIPTINAQGSPGILQLPRPTPQTFGAGGFQALTKTSEQLADIDARLQQQQDELDFTTLAGDYKLKVGEAQLALKDDPNYLGHEQTFTKAEADIRREVMGQAQSGVVQRALTAHFAKTFPEHLLEVKTSARKLWADSEVATLDQEEDVLSRDAAEAMTPQVRTDTANLYESLLGRAHDRGLLSASQFEAKRQSFQQKSLEKRMDFLRRTDRSRLRDEDRQGDFRGLDPIKHLKILEAARADEDREETRNDKAFKQAQDTVELSWSGLANQGLLPEAEIEAALKGEDPFITPDKARQYKTINENPVTGEGQLQIRSVMQDYHSGPSTQGRIERTRKELNRLAREMGHPHPLLDKAMNELQTDERTMRSVQAAEVSAGIKVFEDAYKSQAAPVLPGRLGTFQRNKQEADKAEGRNKIRRGMDPAKAADEALKRKQQESESTPQHRKDMQELLK